MRSARDLDTDLNSGAAVPGPRRRVKEKAVKAKPRYSEVADQLRLAIISGTYPVGTFLPSEVRLCQEFSVSRHTVREAVRILQDRGLVLAQQGRGTAVVSDQHISRVTRLLGSIDEIERHGRDTRLSEMQMQVVEADAELASQLPCEVGESLLRIEGYRVPRTGKSEWPIAWNETYIRQPYAGIREDIESWPGAIYSLVERHQGGRVASIRQEVTAFNLPQKLARRLAVPVGTAGLRVKRTYKWPPDAALLFGFNTYVGDHFSLVSDITPHD